jgi:hypothetical protein
MDRVEARATTLTEARAEAARAELANFADREVELRLFSGVLLRARLVGVSKQCAILEHHTGRLALVDLGTVAAVVDRGSER